MKVDLPPVSFGVGRPVRPEMVDAVNLALDEDVKYEIPDNYLQGEGDSEFLFGLRHDAADGCLSHRDVVA